MRAKIGPLQVDIDDFAPRLDITLPPKRKATVNAGVVHNHINPAPRIVHDAEHCIDCTGVAYVGHQPESLTSGGGELINEHLGLFGVDQIVDCNSGAFRGEGLRDCGSQTGIASRHENAFVCEAEVHCDFHWK